MGKNRSLIDILLEHKQLILILTTLLVIYGIVGLMEMPRDEFPEFKIRQGLIIGVYPGATSEQVAERLTKKVENYLFQFEEVDKEKTHSVSKENVMVIYVEVDGDVDEPKLFWSKLQHRLNEIKPELPAGVFSLTADNDFGNTSAILLAVQSETKTYRQLEKYIERFEDRVRKISATSRVKHFGLQNEEINIYIDDAKLAHYGIKSLSLLAALRSQNSVNYSGEIDNGKFIRPIHVTADLKTESDIANQIIYSDPLGNVIRLKDVAEVKREYPDPDSYIRLNGKKCLIVSLEMLPGNNIVQYGKNVQVEIDKFINEAPSDVKVGIISDMPSFVSDAIFNFLKEFGLAILSVIIVTILLLPLRVALVSASAIPISILITLGMMWSTGIYLQTVSLAGLIIVLGMVVDNAIVIIDNYVEKLDNGISPREAASKSVSELFGSVFSATLIIVSTFFPMQLFITGLAGDFVESLPITIAYALFISLFVSAILVPLFSYLYIRFGIKGAKEGIKVRFLIRLQKWYDNLVERSFKIKKTVVTLGFISFVIGLFLITLSPQQPFPSFDRNQFAVEIFLPSGGSLRQTDKVMKEVEALLLKDPRVKEVAAFVGTSSPRFNSLYAPQFPGKNYGQFLVITDSDESTLAMLDDYSKEYSNMNPHAYIKWKQLEMMNKRAHIEVRVSGDSIRAIKRVANKVAQILKSTEGTQWIRTDFREPLQSVRLEMFEDEAARMGYSKQILDYALLIGTKGFPLATIWEGDYQVKVNLKVEKKVQTNIDEVMNQYVTSPFLASSVQIKQLAEAKQEWTEGEIGRRNGVPTITIRSDVERGNYASEILDKAKPLIEKLELSEGVSIEFGGEYEMNKDEMTPLYYALIFSIAVIFIILLAQFRKIKTAFLIMMTMPLSIFGASFGILITGYPFSVTAFIGLIGLIGIVVRNGIIYISYARELVTVHNMNIEQAAISAAKRRMRPIFLTSSAAAVGVVPMILSGSNLWGPLGTVICFGLLFGLALCLIVIPILYFLLHKNDSDNTAEVTV